MTIEEWKATLAERSWLKLLKEHVSSAKTSIRDLIATIERSNLAADFVVRNLDIRMKMHHDRTHALVMLRALTFASPKVSFFWVDSKTAIPLENATMADWDHSGRLVFAAGGKLFEGKIESDRIVPRELADFNANKFEPVEAPDWAKQW